MRFVLVSARHHVQTLILPKYYAEELALVEDAMPVMLAPSREQIILATSENVTKVYFVLLSATMLCVIVPSFRRDRDLDEVVLEFVVETDSGYPAV